MSAAVVAWSELSVLIGTHTFLYDLRVTAIWCGVYIVAVAAFVAVAGGIAVDPQGLRGGRDMADKTILWLRPRVKVASREGFSMSQRGGIRVRQEMHVR